MLLKKMLLVCGVLTSVLMAQETTVKILAINDFHGQITRGQTEKGTNRPYGGADVLVSYLANASAGFNGKTIVLSIGDLIGASQPECALLQDEPAMSMLNYLKTNKALGVLATLGNHELDEGLTELNRLLMGGNHANGPFMTNPWTGAEFNMINANMIDTATGFPIFQPLEIRYVPGTGKAVAFIGVILKEAPTMVSATYVNNLKFISEVSAINHYVKFVKKLANVRAFVVMLHQGGSQAAYTGWTDTTRSAPTSDIVNLVKNLDDDVDIVCTAHSHGFTNAIVKNVNGHPVLLTQAYSKGTAFAEIEATIDNVSGDITSKKARIVTTYGDAGPGLTTDNVATKYIEDCKANVAPLTNRVISSTGNAITRSQSLAGESALGNLIADAQRVVMHTDFSFMNPGGIRADLDSGIVTWGELYTIQPFTNYMVTMSMTGKQIYNVLNQQWLNQPYIKMLQISGLSYTWDSTRAVGNRIVDVRKDGVSIDTSANYTVAVNNFLAGGGDNFVEFKLGTNKVSGSIDLDVLIQYLQSLSAPITASIENRITVIPSFIQFIYTSDPHYGITRSTFQGASNVDAHVVNAALVAKINNLPSVIIPSDSGVRAGKRVGGVDYVIETGDIANRMEATTNGYIQNAAESWAQFKTDYIDNLTLTNNNNQKSNLLLLPGNHDVSNAIGFYKTMSPRTDASSMAEMYNFMFHPDTLKTSITYNYDTDKIHYSKNIGGVHFMFINMWPDSAERVWMENDLVSVSSSTPVLLFAHDQPDCESKHFTNPNGTHNINSTDKFENMVVEQLKDGTTTSVPSTIEQRGLVNFLKTHSNVKAYFHGNSNYNQFYDYRGPDNDITLPTFRVDSPMKGDISSRDETRLSFQVVTIDLDNAKLTARECFYDADPTNPSAPVTFGSSRTISLR